MNELMRQLTERQEFGVPRMHGRRFSVHGHVNERGRLLLRKIGGAKQFAQRSHDVHTTPFTE